MQYDIFVLLIEFAVFYGLYLWTQHVAFAKQWMINVPFIRLVAGVFALQVIAAAIQRFVVTDVFLFSDAGQNLLDGVDVYFIDADHGKYPFFPFMIFLHAGIVYLWKFLGVFTFNFYLKLVLLSVLHLWGFSLYKNWQKDGEQEARLKWLALMLSPITFGAVIYHGQISVILMAFVYVAITFFADAKQAKNTVIAGVMYAASLLTKTWSILLLPVFLLPAVASRSVKKLLLFGLFLLSVVSVILVNAKAYTLLVNSSLERIIEAVQQPGGPASVWGISTFLPFQADTFVWEVLPLILGMTVFWGSVYFVAYRTKKIPSIPLLILGAVLMFYVVTPRWGIQYLFWHLPWLLIAQKRSVLLNSVYSFMMPLYVLANYLNVTTGVATVPELLVTALGLVIWFYFVTEQGRLLKEIWQGTTHED